MIFYTYRVINSSVQDQVASARDPFTSFQDHIVSVRDLFTSEQDHYASELL